MNAATARRLHEKLRRYRAETGCGWLDAWQVVEEAAGAEGNPKGPFATNVPALACFLVTNAPASSDAVRAGAGAEGFLHRVRLARNSAVHRGTAGRRLEDDVQAALRLTEEALAMAAQQQTVGFYMVRGFLEASPDETLASARDTILRYDYSVLPVRTSQGWRWLTDRDLACTSHGFGAVVRKLDLRPAVVLVSGDPARLARTHFQCGQPALLVARDKGEDPIGILTAFDLLYAGS